MVGPIKHGYLVRVDTCCMRIMVEVLKDTIDEEACEGGDTRSNFKELDGLIF